MAPPLAAGRLGRRHERAAARWLRRQGWRILARNLRVHHGEIDLVAARPPLVIVVEVRVRGAGLLAADRSVTPAKAARVRRAFGRARARLRLPPEARIRFDLVLGDGRGTWVHHPGGIEGERHA